MFSEDIDLISSFKDFLKLVGTEYKFYEIDDCLYVASAKSEFKYKVAQRGRLSSMYDTRNGILGELLIKTICIAFEKELNNKSNSNIADFAQNYVRSLGYEVKYGDMD